MDPDLLDEWYDVVYVEDPDDFPAYNVMTDAGWRTAVAENYGLFYNETDATAAFAPVDVDFVYPTTVDNVSRLAVYFNDSSFAGSFDEDNVSIDVSVRVAWFDGDAPPDPDTFDVSSRVTTVWSSNSTLGSVMDENGYTRDEAVNFYMRSVIYPNTTDEGDVDTSLPTVIGGLGFSCVITVEEIQQGHTCNEPGFWEYYDAHVVAGRALLIRMYTTADYADFYTDLFAVEVVAETSVGFFGDYYVSPDLYARWFGTPRPDPERPDQDEPPSYEPFDVVLPFTIGAVGVVTLLALVFLQGRRGGK